MSWSNCKVELKLKWTKYCVLSAGGADNENANSNNIIFSIKVTKLYAPVGISLEKTIKNFQSFLAKNLKDQFIGVNIKQKLIMKVQQINIDIFSNQILLESRDCLF